MTVIKLKNPALTAADPVQTSHRLVLTPQTVRVATYTDTNEALDAWEELERVASASIYQTRRFLIPWLVTMGKASGLTPVIGIVYDESNRPLALFPLASRRNRGIRVLEFLGGKDSNANMPLIRPGVQFNAEMTNHVLALIAQGTPQSPDLFILQNQPFEWEGVPNPLALLPHQISPSACHSTDLLPDSEAFRSERLSADARKKIRYKSRKLAELGTLKFVTARTKDEASQILEAFYAQKRQRFDDKNISSGFDSTESRQFFARTCISRIGEREASVELHALLCDNQIIATYGGGVHRQRFHGMFNSFESNGEHARFSPGDVLLSMLVESKCRQGLQVLDLGSGEGRYKQSWCNRTEPLFDTILGLTAKGKAWSLLAGGKQSLKRLIKQSSWAWPLAQKLRERLPRSR